MIIEEVNIAKFRGFQDQHFRLGEQLTIIAGQNGTQKTTLLGMLSQTFSLRSHPNENFRKERPLCGGNFISSFSEKFKFSEVYDRLATEIMDNVASLVTSSLMLNSI